MTRTIRLARNGLRPTEVETLLRRIADGPAAHIRAEIVETDDIRLLKDLLWRGTALWQAETMDLADYGIFRHTESPTNLARGQFLVPQRHQSRNLFCRPFIAGHRTPKQSENHCQTNSHPDITAPRRVK